PMRILVVVMLLVSHGRLHALRWRQENEQTDQTDNRLYLRASFLSLHEYKERQDRRSRFYERTPWPCRQNWAILTASKVGYELHRARLVLVAAPVRLRGG